jgi:CheY-like chemotaxis protein
LDKVFSLFTQIEAGGDKAPSSGLGIGLFLVRGLVQMHGGSVTAASAGASAGSVFTVRLPCLPALAGAAPAAQAPASGEAPAAGARVLVVDDNVDAAETLATFLQMLGLQTLCVHDGEAALRQAPVFAPDVVLLDIGLPGMDGYEVARGLRADPRVARARLVALTGWGAEADRRRAMDAGFDHHLTKPVDLGVLEELLRKAHQQS